MPQKMHGKPVTALHDGWNGSHAPAAIGSIARIKSRLATSAPTAINRRTRRCHESDWFASFADTILMIAAAAVFRAVRRASAIRAAAPSAAEFRERPAQAAPTALEARALLMERQ